MQGQGSGGGAVSGGEEGIKEEPVSEEEVANQKKLSDGQTFKLSRTKLCLKKRSQIRKTFRLLF